MVKVVIAPDSFKECLLAHEICAALAAGVRRAAPTAQIVQIPMADGGEGTVDSLVRASGGCFHEAVVTGPLGESVQARYGTLGDEETAVIEMAAASGLDLVPRDRRDPLVTTTYGTGELIKAALDRGCRRVLLGIGGSATNDGGCGMARALGYRLLDKDGVPIPDGGGALNRLSRIDADGKDPRLDDVVIDVACDVHNPLTGPQGASAIYGPQKGADDQMVRQLDDNLAHFAAVVERDLNRSVADVPGAGAAGGLGAGLLAFCNGTLQGGAKLVIEAVKLRQQLDGANLCLTGEGALDRSSQFGKTAVAVAQVCAEMDVPCVALAGAVLDGAEPILEQGVTAYFDVTRRPCSLDEAMANARESLERVAEQVLRLFLAGTSAVH